MSIQKALSGEWFKACANDYKIELSDVINAITYPERKEYLNSHARLFLKDVSSDRNELMLVGLDNIRGEEHFLFCFRVPREMYTPEVGLIDLLEIFACKFGLKLRTSLGETFFIKDKTVLTYGRLEDPSEVVKVLGDEDIPMKLIFSFEDNLLGACNHLKINLAFSISQYKYSYWLYNIETIDVEVPNEWVGFLSEVKEQVNPLGGSKFDIIVKEDADGIDVVKSRSTTSLAIPAIYQKQFDQLLEKINSLGKDEYIGVAVSNRKGRCIFCGSVNLSSEHIIPRWSKPFFSSQSFKPALYISEPSVGFFNGSMPTFVNERHEVSPSSFTTTNHVCLECNTGWMRAAEEKVRAILVKDERRLCQTVEELRLSGDDRMLELVRWLIYKSILILYKSKLKVSFSQDILRKVMDGELPDGFCVEIIEDDTFNELDVGASRGLLDPACLKLERHDYELALGQARELLCVAMSFGRFLFRITYFSPKSNLELKSFGIKMKTIFPIDTPREHIGPDGPRNWEGHAPKSKLAMLQGLLIITDTWTGNKSK